MSTAAELLGKLAKLRTAPSSQPLVVAANRAVARANAEFATARVPVQAIVTSTQRGASIKLRQTGRLTKPFAVTPEQILQRHLNTELDRARAALVEQIQKAAQ